jgi:hypothetical protein
MTASVCVLGLASARQVAHHRKPAMAEQLADRTERRLAAAAARTISDGDKLRLIPRPSTRANSDMPSDCMVERAGNTSNETRGLPPG